MWQLLHNRVHTQELRSRWGIDDSDRCARCHSAPETCLHAVRDCRLSQRIWRKLVPFCHQNEFFTDPIHSWIKKNTTKGFGTDWLSTFSAGLWIIWTSRNKELFATGRLPLHKLMSEIFYLSNNITTALSLPSTKATRSLQYICWDPPRAGLVKLNIDGCAKGNPGQAGAGGVFRDSNGGWLFGFARNIGQCSNNSAEFWALRDGLTIALRLGIRNITVETDSRIVCDLCKLTNSRFHPLATFINDCRAMLSEFVHF